MSQHLTNPSRPTLIISASLLLLPLSIQAAHAESGWACQPGPTGGWACNPKPAGPAAATPPAPTPSAPVRTTTNPVSAPPPVVKPAAPIAQPILAPAPAGPAAVQPALPTDPIVPAASAVPATTPIAPIAAAGPTPATQTIENWDWVRGESAAGACCKPNGACDGIYVEPARDWEDAEKSPKDLPARVTAAHSELEGDLVKMEGGAVVTQGNTKLTAERADMKRSTGEVNLYGNIVLRQPRMKISGSNADMTTANSFGHVVDARLLDYASGMRVTADKLTRRKEELIELDNATYTRCPPDEESWKLSADHIRLNRKTGRGEAKDTVIRVGDVPVFYSPYLNFPIDDRRLSGFLFPMVANSSSGIDVAIPYYFNLAPNYDATLTPRQITDRGTMIEAEGRFMNRFSNWIVSGAQLQNDQKSDADRWLFSTQESGNINRYFSTMIDYTRVSDNNYLHDFSINSLNVKRQTSLNEQAGLNLNYLGWYGSVQVQQFQTIDELVAEPYRIMPRLALGRSAGGENFKFDYSFVSEVTRFDHTDPNSPDNPGGPWITGDRVYLEPGISFPMRWTASFINPEVRMRYVGYNLNRPDALPGEERPQTAVPQAILDSGLFFDRDVTFGGGNYQQTLEPRLYYLYSPYQKQIDQPLFDTSPLTFDYQQLFQPRRLVGKDRLEDFNQLATGVTSRIIESESGRDLGHASIGQIFYFADRRVNASTVESLDDQTSSAVAGQVSLQPTESLWASSNILWDQSNNKIEQGNIYAHFEPKNGGIYNLGYRYNKPDVTISTLANGLRQADASAAIPISRRWRLFARVNYDLDLHSTLEDMVGVEYEDCCWVARVIYQRALFGEELNTISQPITQRETTVLVEFQLKGLGGLGRKVNTLLEESIWGYRDRY